MTKRTKYNPCPDRLSPAERILLETAQTWDDKWRKETSHLIFCEDWRDDKHALAYANVATVLEATATDSPLWLFEPEPKTPCKLGAPCTSDCPDQTCYLCP